MVVPVLEEMRIQALGVIDDAVVELSPGFTAVTGETGAGKTMVVTSLGLLLGGRADAALVRMGAKAAVVEGRLALPDGSPAADRAADAGAELDDGALLISRTVSAEGRSRAHVGGRSAPVGLLAELSDELIAVHGQTDQQGLLRPARQREALDRYAGEAVSAPLGEYTTAYQRLRTVSRELDEIAAAEPQAGEDAELAAEAGKLGHAESLASAASTAHGALAGDPADPEGVDAATLVGGAHRALEAVRQHDPALAELADRLGEVSILLSDVAGELAGYADNLDADPLRLAAVEERRATLGQLIRKYGGDVTPASGPQEPSEGGAADREGDGGPAGAGDGASAVLTWAERSAARLLELEGDDERIGELTTERDALRAELGTLAGQLTQARTDAAKRFADAVTEELTELAMPHARVTVDLKHTEVAGEADGLDVQGRTLAFGPHGTDEVELLLAPHSGAQPRPIAKGASGGELSRVMLAVEVVFAGVAPVPTYLFDEVDAGVGGKAAVEVGRRLARLAQSAQVIVVTHLPQVAAFADRHLVVEKTHEGSVTRSGVQLMDGEERVRELSRMLAGQEDSELARAHAEELLATAHPNSPS